MNLKDRYKALPKPARFAIKSLGSLAAVVTAPAWLPAAIILWAVASVTVEILEAYDRS